MGFLCPGADRRATARKNGVECARDRNVRSATRRIRWKRKARGITPVRLGFSPDRRFQMGRFRTKRGLKQVVIPGPVAANTVIPGWCVSTRTQMCDGTIGEKIPRFQVCVAARRPGNDGGTGREGTGPSASSPHEKTLVPHTLEDFARNTAFPKRALIDPRWRMDADCVFAPSGFDRRRKHFGRCCRLPDGSCRCRLFEFAAGAARAARREWEEIAGRNCLTWGAARNR